VGGWLTFVCVTWSIAIIYAFLHKEVPSTKRPRSSVREAALRFVERFRRRRPREKPAVYRVQWKDDVRLPAARPFVPPLVLPKPEFPPSRLAQSTAPAPVESTLEPQRLPRVKPLDLSVGLQRPPRVAPLDLPVDPSPRKQHEAHIPDYEREVSVTPSTRESSEYGGRHSSTSAGADTTQSSVVAALPADPKAKHPGPGPQLVGRYRDGRPAAHRVASPSLARAARFSGFSPQSQEEQTPRFDATPASGTASARTHEVGPLLLTAFGRSGQEERSLERGGVRPQSAAARRPSAGPRAETLAARERLREAPGLRDASFAEPRSAREPPSAREHPLPASTASRDGPPRPRPRSAMPRPNGWRPGPAESRESSQPPRPDLPARPDPSHGHQKPVSRELDFSGCDEREERASPRILQKTDKSALPRPQVQIAEGRPPARAPRPPRPQQPNTPDRADEPGWPDEPSWPARSPEGRAEDASRARPENRESGRGVWSEESGGSVRRERPRLLSPLPARPIVADPASPRIGRARRPSQAPVLDLATPNLSSGMGAG